MLSLDLRSLTIMAGLIGIVMGLVLLGLRRSYPASIRGMRLWGAAPLLCAGSTLFYGLDGVLPPTLVALTGNALLLVGVTLFLLGSERLYGLPSSGRRWATVIAVVLLVLAFFMHGHPDYRIRVLVFSGTLAAIVAEHARLLGRHGNQGFAPRFTAMVLWGQAAVLVCRAVSTLWLDQADTQRFTQSFVQTLYIAAFSFSMLGAFLVREDGSAITQADIDTEKPLPAIPRDALASASAGQQVRQLRQQARLSQLELALLADGVRQVGIGALPFSKVAQQLRQLEHENGRLKKVLAERVMDIEILKEVAAKKW